MGRGRGVPKQRTNGGHIKNNAYVCGSTTRQGKSIERSLLLTIRLKNLKAASSHLTHFTEIRGSACEMINQLSCITSSVHSSFPIKALPNIHQSIHHHHHWLTSTGLAKLKSRLIPILSCRSVKQDIWNICVCVYLFINQRC